ncbi:peptidase A1 domain-containing protein [Favolaschia claudopus]|uniref:Peptidase A1 domain-containing protein n=1 Tax=Favolaschia claudopus TaxID=2862362 RepID=A0AAW0DQT8_9AGAR
MLFGLFHSISTTTFAKYLAIALLLLNARSLPLVWHVRVFRAIIQRVCALQWHTLTHFYLGQEQKLEALRHWHERYQPIGVHPFRGEWKYHDWVATHFFFVREIPMLSRYEVRVSIGAWDDKWIWCVCRFVKPPSRKESGDAVKVQVQAKGEEQQADSLTTTPVESEDAERSKATGSDPDTVSRALIQRASRTAEPDGALLYTVAVSQLCYKQGRITIPPAVVLAANGFYAAPDFPSQTAQPEGKASSQTIAPNEVKFPPHWPAVRKITDSASTLKKFYAGGWRDVPEGGRWWEDAFRACEQERQERLVPFVGSKLENGGDMGSRKGGLSGGMEGVRNLI